MRTRLPRPLSSRPRSIPFFCAPEIDRNRKADGCPRKKCARRGRESLFVFFGDDLGPVDRSHSFYFFHPLRPERQKQPRFAPWSQLVREIRDEVLDDDDELLHSSYKDEFVETESKPAAVERVAGVEHAT